MLLDGFRITDPGISAVVLVFVLFQDAIAKKLSRAEALFDVFVGTTVSRNPC